MIDIASNPEEMLDGTETPQEIGVVAERYATQVLRHKGFSVRVMKRGPYDLLVDGKRIEVKAATPNSRLLWQVNLHRHGKLNEASVDFYVILLDMRRLQKKKPLVLVMPAPTGSPVLNLSIESLLTIYKKYVEDWEALRDDSLS